MERVLSLVLGLGLVLEAVGRLKAVEEELPQTGKEMGLVR